METNYLSYTIAIVILVMMSAYFSATETAFTSVNRIKLKNLAEGNKRAALALKLANDYDKLLSTILIGNNIVNIAMTAVATVLFIELLGDLGATVATIVTTVVVLIFGEISPKSLAKEMPEKIAMLSAPIIRTIMIILAPLNYFFSFIREINKKLFKIDSDRGITEEELITIVEEAREEGGIEEEQGTLIQNAIEFNELIAEDVLTPRVDIEAIEIDEDKEYVAKHFMETGYSRLPVYDDDLDNILGVLNQKDFHNHVFNKGESINDFIKPVVYVAGSMKISNLLRKMQVAKTHIAIVIDEYGGTAGLVTMEDIIEEIVGEIYDEHDMELSEEITMLQNGSYKILGNANFEKVFEHLGLKIDTESFDVITVNGWVVLSLDKLPEKGETFTQENEDKLLKVRVTKSDGKKALEINMVIVDIIKDKE